MLDGPIGLCWVTIGIADLSAIIYYLEFFQWGESFTPMGGLLIVRVAILFVLGLNLVTVKLFGEMEFWFAMVKITTIIVLIVVGLWMILLGFTSTNGTVASVQISGRMVACSRKVWMVSGWIPNCHFAFVGVELVGTTAAETQDPNATT